MATCLSARKMEDVEMIRLLLNDTRDCGVVIVDDFHLLDDDIKKAFSDLLKVLADESRCDIKLVLIGINRAGECLIQLAPDLNNRIDTIKFEANPCDKIQELIEKGERALNISFANKKEIAERSYGSFHIAQMLCKTYCISAAVTERLAAHKELDRSIEDVVSTKMQELSRVFGPTTKKFAAGNRNRRDGRAPYLRLLIRLSECDQGALQMSELYLKDPKYKISISQIADKGYITQLISRHEDIRKVLYYEAGSKLLAIEDPKYIFYLKNINWENFAKDMGFRLIDIKTSYDFALSFSGEKRPYVEMLKQKLIDNEYTVFYDKDLIADILGKDLEEYFAPIYAAEATYVIALIDSSYPKKIWTVFESKKYRDRFGENSVIPILFDDFEPSPMDPLFNKGYATINTKAGSIEEQIDRIVEALIERMNE